MTTQSITICVLCGFAIGFAACWIWMATKVEPHPTAQHHAAAADSLAALAVDYRILADELEAENARLSLAIADLQAQLDSNTHRHDTFKPRVRNASADDLRYFLDSLNAVYRGHAMPPR